jgi:hypothetical protein
MQRNYGASPTDWTHFAEKLKLRADLLPVVSNPDAPIAPYSKLKDKGKVPSRYNDDRQVHGITKWTEVSADARDIRRWSREPDYGICLQTRYVRAIDVDVNDPELAAAIEQTVRDCVPGVHFPMRFRANSARVLIPFSYGGELTKRSFPVGADRVELLAGGQQFVAIGTHPSGQKYQWQDGLPEGFPELDVLEVEDLWEALQMLYATGEGFVARSVREGASSSTPGEGSASDNDEVVAYLSEHGLILDEGGGNQVYIECPWKAEHTGDSGVTETAYFPADSGGYERGHFKCLHDHCSGKSDNEFLEAIGFLDDTEFRARGFDILPMANENLPAVPGLEQGADILDTRPAGRLPTYSHLPNAPIFKRAPTTGQILVTQNNVAQAFECPEFTTRKVRYDQFTGDVVWAWYDEPDGCEQWRQWADVDNARAMRTLDLRGFKTTPGITTIRSAVDDVARANPVDTAIKWATGLRWDGKPRIHRFLADYMNAEDTPYAEAVSRYMWTALAGRCLAPGIQADMAIIFVSPEQGKQKTSAVAALVPDREWFGELDLTLDDADLGRLMRGKLVCELSELKGLSGREAESIKAFVSRRVDEWTPKYMEKAQKFKRRCLFVGTTNSTTFLADPTGERRWLPVRVGGAAMQAIVDDRDQLWAEGIALYRDSGIQYREAEDRAKLEVARFKAIDPLEDKLLVWLHTEGLGGYKPADREWLTLEEIVNQGLDMDLSKMPMRDQLRVGNILRGMGYSNDRIRVDGIPRRLWVKGENAKELGQ